MSSVNKVMLLGRVGKDPEIKNTAAGTAVCNFSIATSESIKGETRTEWHNISLFGKTAEIAAKYLSKGSQVFVEGRLQYRQWEDKDGNKKSMTEILGSHITLLGGKRESTNSYAPAYEEEIPF